MARERESRSELLTLEAAHAHEHKPELRRLVGWVQTAIMAGMAVLFIWLLASGNIENYINTRYNFYTYIGAVALVAIAVYSGLVASGKMTSGHSGHITWAAAGIVAIPLVFGFVAPSRPLGADAITAELDASAIAAVDSSALPGGDSQGWNMLDWLRSFHSVDNPEMLNGRAADVIGFVRLSDGGPDGFFRITRFMVNCCVADTVSISMLVTGETAVDVSEGEWVRVFGTAQVREIDGETQLTIVPSSVTKLDSPPNPPYLYP